MIQNYAMQIALAEARQRAAAFGGALQSIAHVPCVVTDFVDINSLNDVAVKFVVF